MLVLSKEKCSEGQRRYKKILNIDIDIDEILFSKNGLRKHIVKRKHYDFLKYFEEIDNIIKNPDYVGTSPREKDVSIEYVKCYEDNVLVAVKLNRKNQYFI